jgi:DNA-directed RNA polymerase subunit F
MSANRSVAAAQRRRAGGPEPAPPGRGPQPSINSSQLFSGQGQGQRSGQVPSGRLAGQHAQLQQQQMQQQQQQHLDSQQSNGISGINKMTVPQAVTLITLRLGKLETQMFEMINSGIGTSMSADMSNGGNENMVLVDRDTIDTIISRLESLEKRSSTSTVPVSTSSSAETTLLKQQLEAIKPTIAQNTKTVTALTKEQKDHKAQIEKLKSELSEAKEMLSALQTMSMDNSQKIFDIMSGNTSDIMDSNEPGLEYVLDNCDENGEVELDADGETVDNEVIGTDLKGLIEQELNA